MAHVLSLGGSFGGRPGRLRQGRQAKCGRAALGGLHRSGGRQRRGAFAAVPDERGAEAALASVANRPGRLARLQRPPDERETALRRARLAESEEAFDLVKGPLFRAVLIRLEAERHLLSLTAHHL